MLLLALRRHGGCVVVGPSSAESGQRSTPLQAYIVWFRVCFNESSACVFIDPDAFFRFSLLCGHMLDYSSVISSSSSHYRVMLGGYGIRRSDDMQRLLYTRQACSNACQSDYASWTDSALVIVVICNPLVVYKRRYSETRGFLLEHGRSRFVYTSDVRLLSYFGGVARACSAHALIHNVVGCTTSCSQMCLKEILDLKPAVFLLSFL